MSDIDNDHPLNRITGETARANQALQDYYALGAGRSINKLLRSYKESITLDPPTRHFYTLGKWSTRYHWQARVGRQQEIEADIARLEARKERRQLLRGVEVRLGEAIQNLRTDSPTINEVTAMARLVLDQLRAEYDDLPTERKTLSGPDGGAVQLSGKMVVVTEYLDADDADGTAEQATQG